MCCKSNYVTNTVHYAKSYLYHEVPAWQRHVQAELNVHVPKNIWQPTGMSHDVCLYTCSVRAENYLNLQNYESSYTKFKTKSAHAVLLIWEAGFYLLFVIQTLSGYSTQKAQDWWGTYSQLSLF